MKKKICRYISKERTNKNNRVDTNSLLDFTCERF